MLWFLVTSECELEDQLRNLYKHMYQLFTSCKAKVSCLFT